MNQSEVPLVVDLDGTLIKTDLLLESFYSMIKENPGSIFSIPLWLLRGKAYLKNQLAERSHVDTKVLPFHEEFLTYLRNEFAQGRKLVLATASVHTFAQSIADHLGIFSEVIATGEKVNLSGKGKLKVLLEKYGEKGFDYAGNDKVDLYIFPHAQQAILVNAAQSTVNSAKKTSNVVKVFNDQKSAMRVYVKAIRVYQWSKNVLLFVPFITHHAWSNMSSLRNVILGFISFSFCASAGYLFNDFLDLSADRHHPRKRLRPFASGAASLWTGSALMVSLQVVGLTMAAMLNREFLILLVIYYVISLAYTFYFKTYVLIDVLILAGLYTLRVMAGGALADAPLSFWLLAVSIFIFFSLALVKRCSELTTLLKANKEYAKGRDYNVLDIDYLREMGIASGYMAILIFALYINSSDVAVLYSHPKVLWLAIPVLFYWVSRIWLKTGRGEMTDDPIVFSSKDKGSRFVAIAVVLIILLAI